MDLGSLSALCPAKVIIEINRYNIGVTTKALQDVGGNVAGLVIILIESDTESATGRVIFFTADIEGGAVNG